MVPGRLASTAQRTGSRLADEKGVGKKLFKSAVQRVMQGNRVVSWHKRFASAALAATINKVEQCAALPANEPYCLVFHYVSSLFCSGYFQHGRDPETA